MDDLDRALIEAFSRVWARCVADPVEARRRWVRARASRTLGRPARNWCLGLRASDTRISRGYGVSEGEADRLPHGVALGVGDILEWCGPVRIDWPGVPLDVAAEMLGRHVEVVRKWLPVGQQRRAWRLDPRAVVPVGRYDGQLKAKNVAEWRAGLGIQLNVDYEDIGSTKPPMASAPPEVRPPMASAALYGEKSRWGVRYERPKVWGRHSGAAVPVVWCRGAIDPGCQGGRPPHAVWGGMWERLSKRYAAEAAARGVGEGDTVLLAERVPRFVDRRIRRKGSDAVEVARELRGWEWICPGLPDNDIKPRMISAVSPPPPEVPPEVPPEDGVGVGGSGKALRPPMASAALYGGFESRCVGSGRAGVLVCPLPGWNVGAYLADRLGFDEGLEVGESERWRPGVEGWLGGNDETRMTNDERGEGAEGSGKAERPPMASAAFYGGGGEFACVKCWGVRSGSPRGRRGWNEFVGRMSGGLLTGGDVVWGGRDEFE